jgi:hypothetical protein
MRHPIKPKHERRLNLRITQAQHDHLESIALSRGLTIPEAARLIIGEHRRSSRAAEPPQLPRAAE